MYVRTSYILRSDARVLFSFAMSFTLEDLEVFAKETLSRRQYVVFVYQMSKKSLFRALIILNPVGR